MYIVLYLGTLFVKEFFCQMLCQGYSSYQKVYKTEIILYKIFLTFCKKTFCC